MRCRNPNYLAYQVAIATTDQLSQKLGLRYCERRDIYPRTVIYKFTIYLFTIPAQSEQEMYVWTEHTCKRPATCERVRYVWKDLQLTSATPRVNGTIAHGNALMHEIQ